jgi:general stress protein YciG
MNRDDEEKSGNENEDKKSKRGFASMPEEKVKDIAHKGGEARARELGPEGYSEMGKKGGEARAKELGPEGYSEMGKKGGQSSHRDSEKNMNQDEREKPKK